MKRTIVSLAVISLVAAGCGQPDASSSTGLDRTSRSPLVRTENGRSLNGRSLNGRSLNGRSLNGRSLNGRSLNGVALDGISAASGAALARVALDGTVLNGWYAQRPTVAGKAETLPDQKLVAAVAGVAQPARECCGDPKTWMAGRHIRPDLSGADFAGAVFNAVLDDGTRIPMRIDAVEALPAPNDDLLGYAIALQTDDGWVPYCDADGGAAIPMNGLWNYGENVPGAGSYDPSAGGFTFACRGYAIAKCVELGYRPWEQGLASYTVACTRLLRADYCGNGESFTMDGTLLDLYDRRGIQVSEEPSWPVEAEWNADGAVCMTPHVVDRFSLTGETPPCLSQKVTSRCDGTFAGPGHTLVIDRYSAAR